MKMMKNLRKCVCCDLKNVCLIIGFTEFLLGLIGVIVFIVPPFLDPSIFSTFFLTTVAAIFLIVGLKGDKSKFLLIWIILKIIVLMFLVSIICIFLYYTIIFSSSGHVQWAFIVMEMFFIIHFTSSIYFLIIVRSYKKEMDLRISKEANLSFGSNVKHLVNDEHITC